MKISELVEKLEELRILKGDVEVLMEDDNKFQTMSGINAVRTKYSGWVGDFVVLVRK